MMNQIFAFSFFIWFTFIKFTTHPYYVSTLEIDYRPNRSALQITMRVFTDDWQLMLNKHYDKSLRLNPDKDSVQVVTYSRDHFQQHLELSLNATEVIRSYWGGVSRRSVGSVFGGSGNRTPNPSRPTYLFSELGPTKYV